MPILLFYFFVLDAAAVVLFLLDIRSYRILGIRNFVVPSFLQSYPVTALHKVS